MAARRTRKSKSSSRAWSSSTARPFACSGGAGENGRTKTGGRARGGGMDVTRGRGGVGGSISLFLGGQVFRKPKKDNEK